MRGHRDSHLYISGSASGFDSLMPAVSARDTVSTTNGETVWQVTELLH